MHATTAAFDAGTLIRILEDIELRYQDPKLEKHGKQKPHWRIRPFQAKLQPDGTVQRKRVSIKLGQCAEMSRQDALREKQKAMATINAGRIVVQAQLPFPAVLKKYRAAHIPTLEKSTQAKYGCHIDKHIEPAFYQLRICEVDKATVQTWINHKREDGLSPATLADLRNILSSIFTQAREWRLWDGTNPTHGVKIGRQIAAREKRLLGAEDFVAFLAAIPETRILPAAKVRLMVMTAIAGALRVSEVLGLQGRDIDAARGVVRVQRRWHRGFVSTTKTEASDCERFIGYELARDLAAIAREGWLFARADTGAPPDDRDLQQHVFRPAADAVKCYFPGFGMHTFKRMSVTLRQRAGASPLEAMLIAGHRDVSTTMRYTVVDAERERQILDGVWKMIKTDGKAN